MEAVKVSIIIPVYNIEKYVERCLDSILAQTYPHFEVIVVDDGATDRSAQLAAKYVLRDTRVRLLHKTNGGQASARNLGLGQANGEYLLMVDGDDYLLPDLLEKCVEKLELGADIVVFDYFSLNHKQQQNYVAVGTSAITAGTAPWNKMYRRALWQDVFFPEGLWYEDLGVVPFVLAKAGNVCKIDEAFYVYDQSREESQTNTVNTARYKDILQVLAHLQRQIATLPDMQTDLMAGMYLEQLGYVMTLSKSSTIKNKSERRFFLQVMQQELEKVCPHWAELTHKPESRQLKKIRRLAMRCYFRGYFLLGDMLYVWPKKLKQIGVNE
ncbi:glycosyltransferase family 2 protein [Listeria booriae]|uniref:glycosyltransferase family 2 protein n=1 Tax=Listeria booriae TaxID=1552123 RepID=UPI001626EAF3|nr:glycosyltransferase family A protein [Listeria booriae]MBC2324962.1 glycosyltransferase family 2 protein [Listeria booriae]MCD2208710.1 glycosyltransferase family 2 protein [Listeria booriae]